jgi:phospholipid/cholesterol/gamma-HCH transport system substrate-binding protein
VIGGGDTHSAAFSESGGLKADDEVRIAGVRVGKVESVELDGDHVRVAFRIDSDSGFGDDTRAEIKVKTLLGAMYLALEPAGPGQLDEGSEIPVERTSSPYDVVDAFSGLAETSDRIDTDQLAASLTTLADLTRNTPEEFRKALRGVSALSSNIAARDEQINTLLKNLDRVSTVLDERDNDIVGLMKDSDVLFRALVARRQAVHNLLLSTASLSKELRTLVRQSRDDLAPALEHLENVVAVLNKNEDNLDNSLRLMKPFYRVFASTLGNGPWFDTYIQNLPPVPQVGG